MSYNKLINFKTRAQFDIKKANIPKTAIVFIEDTGEIWTHDKFFAKTDGSDHNHDNVYLKLTGGTLTGNITAPKFLSVTSDKSIEMTINSTYGKIQTRGFIPLVLNPEGSQVAIGKTSAAEMLDVNGFISASGFKKTGSSDSYLLLGGGGHTNISNLENPYEANLKWGGKNFSGTFGCIDAAMVPFLGANRLAFMPSDAITVEYSRDSGATWIDYGATDAQKAYLFAGPSGSGLNIGKCDSTNKDDGTYRLRVTINTGVGKVYTQLNKFCILLSSNGSTGLTCTIDAALEATPTVFDKIISNNTPVSGWSGYNVINVPAFTTYGNTASSQYGRVRFTFASTGGSTTYTGLQLYNIYGYGGVGWTTPSSMARWGQIYSYDSAQGATFPGMLKGATLYEGGNRVYSAGNTNIGTGATNYAAGNHGHTGLGSNSWGGISSKTGSGYIDLGPANASGAHIYTDRPSFYFNKDLYIVGAAAGSGLVYHTGNSNLSTVDWNAKNLRLTGDGGTGDVQLELWRGTNASWKILNNGGNLRFQNNYTNSVGDYFDVLNLNYTTGNAQLKGVLNAGGLQVNSKPVSLEGHTHEYIDATEVRKLRDGYIYYTTLPLQKQRKVVSTLSPLVPIDQVDNNAPTANIYCATSYMGFYDNPNYIEVNQGEALEMSIMAMRKEGATGSPGTMYLGIERFDKNKKPISDNSGCAYPVNAVTIPSDGVWRKYSGVTILPTSHTSYNGSDGGPVRYIKIRILVNHSTGTIPTYWSSAEVKKVDEIVNTFSNQKIDGTKTFTENVTAPSFVGSLTGPLKGKMKSDIITSAGSGELHLSYRVAQTTAGLFPALDNSNAIININRHDGNFDSQLGFSSNGNLYYRAFSNEALNTTRPWKQIAFTDSNVATAIKLQTSRTIWGQGFDGSNNVSGDLTLGGGRGINGKSGGILIDHDNGDVTVNASNRSLYLGYKNTSNLVFYGGVTSGTGNHLGTWTSTGLGIGISTPTEKLDVNGNIKASGSISAPELSKLSKILIDRSNIKSSGISFYNTTYNAWQIYMSDPGTGCGVRGNLTAPAGTEVTKWALRSVIEPTAGYGWTWESVTSSGTTPTIIAELSSVTGNFITNGFKKYGSSDSYMLLGGGGHKALTDLYNTQNANLSTIDWTTKNLTVHGAGTFNSGLEIINPGGTWISQRDTTKAVFMKSSTTSNYHILARVNNTVNDSLTIGNIGNYFGFYGYRGATTANATSSNFMWDSLTGNWDLSGSGDFIVRPRITNVSNLLLNGTGAIKLSLNKVSTNSVILGPGHFRPDDDARNNIDLGIESMRWRNLYCSGTGNFGGVVSANFGITITSDSSVDWGLTARENDLLINSSDRNLMSFNSLHGIEINTDVLVTGNFRRFVTRALYSTDLSGHSQMNILDMHSINGPMPLNMYAHVEYNSMGNISSSSEYHVVANPDEPVDCIIFDLYNADRVLRICDAKNYKRISVVNRTGNYKRVVIDHNASHVVNIPPWRSMDFITVGYTTITSGPYIYRINSLSPVIGDKLP